jgi:hypothetical protein
MVSTKMRATLPAVEHPLTEGAGSICPGPFLSIARSDIARRR